MKSLDNLLLRKLLLHIPADYRWADEGVIRIGAARDIATSSISSARSMCLCLSISSEEDDGKTDMLSGAAGAAKVLETAVRENMV